MSQGFSKQNVSSKWPRTPRPITPSNATRARLAAFDIIRIMFLLTYANLIAQQLRQFNIYCHHLYFMKTGHELNCCV